jgi:hypothetical protein
MSDDFDDFEDYGDGFEDDDDDIDIDDDDSWNTSPGLEVRRIRRLHATDDDPHENSDDEADEGGPWVVKIEAASFHDAVRGLEDDTTSLEDVIEHLVLATTHQYAPARHSRRGLLLRHPEHFRRFVTLLGQPNRVIRAVTFVSVNFVPHRRGGGEEEEDDVGELGEEDDDSISRNDNVTTEVTIREEDLEELFGTTLPRHRTLQKIEFENCHIPVAYFERFT